MVLMLKLENLDIFKYLLPWKKMDYKDGSSSLLGSKIMSVWYILCIM